MDLEFRKFRHVSTSSIEKTLDPRFDSSRSAIFEAPRLTKCRPERFRVCEADSRQRLASPQIGSCSTVLSSTASLMLAS